ncbi:hypothetical protein DFP94_11076 [Fontibacillus phaseoli]|uniref:Uncharacterized protein n=1 Tax=Fontibacillus phaseoli TaxID=1416533 RepID=A0A369B6Q5_9BACL|nr:hypothetical protein [Fontibacillus phaseoli]RCX17015.1 hypothetical protein DFP94_11076 [Fontibacillus phaseoli]
MSKLLKGIGILFIAGSLLAFVVLGIFEGAWGAGFLLFLRCFLIGVVLLALASILDRLNENRYYLEVLLQRTEELAPDKSAPQRPAYAKPKTKTALESLKDFKMNAKD